MAVLIFSLFLSAVAVVIHGHVLQYQLPRCSEQDILKGTKKFPDPTNDKNYFICENDILILKKCESDLVFDIGLSDCINVEETSEEKLRGKRSIVAGESATFLKNSLSEENVPIRVQSADNVETVNEDADPPPSTVTIPVPSTTTQVPTTELPVPSTQPPRTTTPPAVTCPKYSGYFGDEKDCKSYYYCENEVPTSKYTCPMGMLFDTKTSKCQMFFIATCAEIVKTTRAPTTTTPSPPVCGSDDVKDTPFPNDCKRYYHCVKGVETIQSCSWWEEFDQDQLKCRFFMVVKCG